MVLCVPHDSTKIHRFTATFPAYSSVGPDVRQYRQAPGADSV